MALYLRSLAALDLDLIVVDGSPADIFKAHHDAWSDISTHVPVDPRFRGRNGKVPGVLTGIDLARFERVIVADDDVRYDPSAVVAVVEALDAADVVRPQNYFDPLPWHARLDTARALLNRALDGDWPGTLALRRSLLQRAGGYDADVLFENLELVRTVRVAGGRELVARGLFVRRLPPTVRHFLAQRVRQAYDEFARPSRLVLALSLAPIALYLGSRRKFGILCALLLVSICIAEVGRLRDGGARFFPPTCALWAPVWLAERAVTSWIALALRVSGRGIAYSGGRILRSSTYSRTLRKRLG